MGVQVTNAGMYEHNESGIPGVVILTFDNGERISYNRSSEGAAIPGNRLIDFTKPKFHLIEDENDENSFEALQANLEAQLAALDKQYKAASEKAELLYLLDKTSIEDVFERRRSANEQLYSSLSKQMLGGYEKLKKEINSKCESLKDPGKRFKMMTKWLRETEVSELLQAAQTLELAGDYMLERLKSPERKWDCFLSHAQKDSADICRSMKDSLEAKGISTWLDKCADNTDNNGMVDGIVNSNSFVLVLTKDYFTRRYCVFEYCVAVVAGKPLITVTETDPRYGGQPSTSFELNGLFKHVQKDQVEINRTYWDGFISKLHAKIEETKPDTIGSAVEGGWNSKTICPHLMLHEDQFTITNKEPNHSNHSYHCAVGNQEYREGRHRFTVEVIEASSYFKWKVAIGVVPQNADVKEAHCVGWRNGWGYIAGTGKKFHKSENSWEKGYGEKYGSGDTITVELDFDDKSIIFYKNGKCQGIAYKNLTSPVYPAVSICGTNTTVRLKLV